MPNARKLAEAKGLAKVAVASESSPAAPSSEALALLDELQTGDVLLVRSRDFGAHINALATRSRWSHVSLVIRCTDPSSEMWSLVPPDYAGSPSSTAARGQLLLFEAAAGRGVCLMPLEARLARTHKHYRHLAVRRLDGPPLNDAQLGLMSSFLQVATGKRLETASPNVLRALGRKYGLCSSAPREDWSSFFCSELVAEALQQAGVVREQRVSSSDFLPSDFDDRRLRRSPSSRTSLDEALCKGYAYAAPRPLLSPRGHLREFLHERKRELKARGR